MQTTYKGQEKLVEDGESRDQLMRSGDIKQKKKGESWNGVYLLYL